MKPRAALAVLVLAAVALPAAAQDAPAPARKEEGTKVSAGATVALDRMAKAVHSPVAGGLKSLEGTLKLDLETPDAEVVGENGARGGRVASLPGVPKDGISYRLLFTAPASVELEPKSEVGGPLATLDSSLRRAVTRALLLCTGGGLPSVAGECSADTRTVEGRTVLTVLRTADGAEVARETMTLDAAGLVESAILTRKAPKRPAGQEGAARVADETVGLKCQWRKDGERWRLQSVVVHDGTRSFEVVPAWAPLGKHLLPASLAVGGGGEGGTKFVFRFSSLSVDGSAASLPPAREKWKPAAPATPGREPGGPRDGK